MSSDQIIVLITGASSGIGHALSTLLATTPAYHILLSARTLPKALSAVSSIRALPSTRATLSPLALDVSSAPSIAAAAAHIAASHRRVDALVNNAGIYIPSGSVSLAEELSRSFATNTLGPALVTEAFTPLLLAAAAHPRARAPAVVYVSSALASLARFATSSTIPGDEIDAVGYRVSKAGLNMLAMRDRKALREKGVRVYVVNPGLVRSGLRGEGEEAVSAAGLAGAVEGAAEMVRGVLEGERDGEGAVFLDVDGVLGW